MIDPDGGTYLRGRHFPIEVHFDARPLFLRVQREVARSGEPDTLAAVRLIERLHREVHDVTPELVVRIATDERRYPVPRAQGGDPADWPPDVIHLLNVGLHFAGRVAELAVVAGLLRTLLNRIKRLSKGFIISDGYAICLAAEKVHQTGHDDLAFLFADAISTVDSGDSFGGYLVGFHSETELHLVAVSAQGKATLLPTSSLPPGLGQQWRRVDWDALRDDTDDTDDTTTDE